MKILYHIPFRYGLGADRWIYEGYRDAFHDLGHDFFTFENHEDLRERFEKINPRIFLTSQNDLLLLKGDILSALKGFRAQGGKVFVRVGEDFATTDVKRKMLKEEGWHDVYFTSYGEAAMKGFEEAAGRNYAMIPFAANSKIHFPVPPAKRYGYDLCFVGANLPRKQVAFRKLLTPLFKRYRVFVAGAGWTSRDKTAGFIGRVARNAGLPRLAKSIYEKRITLTPEEERILYSSAKICLNIHEYDGGGNVLGLSNEREFKIPACGGFELSDYCPGIEKFFEPEKEIVIARTPGEWFSKIEYHLIHEKEREAIREKGRKRAERDHTYHHRVRALLTLA